MDEHEISAARAAFAAALEQHDSASLAALYADDARLLPPAGELIQGRNAIEAFWQAGIEVGISEAAFEVRDLHRKDGLGYEIGCYALCLETGDRVPVVERGKYVLVLEREQDGIWR